MCIGAFSCFGCVPGPSPSLDLGSRQIAESTSVKCVLMSFAKWCLLECIKEVLQIYYSNFQSVRDILKIETGEDFVL